MELIVLFDSNDSMGIKERMIELVTIIHYDLKMSINYLFGVKLRDSLPYDLPKVHDYLFQILLITYSYSFIRRMFPLD